MTKYTEADIQVVKWEEHVRSHPEMYFGEKGASPEMLNETLEYVAKMLGSKKTSTIRIDDWWYFCSDIDWLFRSKIAIKSIEEVFLDIRPFPEEGQPNSFRPEALCAPFATDLFSYSESSTTVLKGHAPERLTLEAHKKVLGKWGRVVGFRFRAVA